MTEKEEALKSNRRCWSPLEVPLWNDSNDIHYRKAFHVSEEDSRRKKSQCIKTKPKTKAYKTSKMTFDWDYNNLLNENEDRQYKNQDSQRHSEINVVDKREVVEKRGYKRHHIREVVSRRNGKRKKLEEKPCLNSSAKELPACSQRDKTKSASSKSFAERLENRLSGGKFRWLNERLYTCKSNEAEYLFAADSLDLFERVSFV